MKELTFKLVNRFLSFILFLITVKNYSSDSIEFEYLEQPYFTEGVAVSHFYRT